MLDFILASGTYGTIEHHIRNAVERYGSGGRGKLRYALHRLVLPPKKIKAVYPLFWRVPILLPFLPLYRVCLSCRKDRARFMLQLKTLQRLKARSHKNR